MQHDTHSHLSIGSLQQLPFSCMLPSAQQIESLNNYTWLQIVTILPFLTAIAIGKYCCILLLIYSFTSSVLLFFNFYFTINWNFIFRKIQNSYLLVFLFISYIFQQPLIAFISYILYRIPYDLYRITIYDPPFLSHSTNKSTSNWKQKKSWITYFLFHCFQLSPLYAKICVSGCTLIVGRCRKEEETELCKREVKERRKLKQNLRQEVKW